MGSRQTLCPLGWVAGMGQGSRPLLGVMDGVWLGIGVYRAVLPQQGMEDGTAGAAWIRNWFSTLYP